MAKIDTSNPFNIGVSYSDFLANVKGKVTVKSLLDRLKLTKDQLAWITQELKDYKQNNK